MTTLSHFFKEHRDEFNDIDFKVLLKSLFETYRNLHAAGIIHVDVKRRNILTDGKEIRLIDFGASITVGEGLVGLSTGAYSKLYAAPELSISGEPITEAVDAYGLGLVLQYMIYDLCQIEEDVIDILAYKPNDGVEDKNALFQGFDGCKAFRLNKNFRELTWSLLCYKPENRMVISLTENLETSNV